MAKAKKCDRCGKYYDDNFSFGKWLDYKYNGLLGPKSYDICNECAKDFEDFIANGDTPRKPDKYYGFKSGDTNDIVTLAKTMINIIGTYGQFTVADFYDYVGKECSYKDSFVGWDTPFGLKITINGVNEYYIEMPETNWSRDDAED